MAQTRIFVSHSHQDNSYCRDFVTALRQGLDSDEAVWYDEHNLGWVSYVARLNRSWRSVSTSSLS